MDDKKLAKYLVWGLVALGVITVLCVVAAPDQTTLTGFFGLLFIIDGVVLYRVKNKEKIAETKAQREAEKQAKSEAKIQEKSEKAENKRLSQEFAAETQRIAKELPSVRCYLMKGIPGWDREVVITAAVDGAAQTVVFRNQAGRNEALLPFGKIFDVWTGTDKEVELMQTGGGIVKGAVAGAVFNPFIGILVATNKKTKQKVTQFNYVVISYHKEPGEDDAIVLRSVSPQDNSKMTKFSGELKRAVSVGGGTDVSVVL